MRIGVGELVLVLVVALLVLGPDKLPRYARKLGAALAEFRKASDEATREIRQNVVEPLEEAQKPLREAMEPLEEIDRAVKGNLKEVQDSLEHIGKGTPRKAAQSVGKADAPTAEGVAAQTPEVSQTVAAAESVGTAQTSAAAQPVAAVATEEARAAETPSGNRNAEEALA